MANRNWRSGGSGGYQSFNQILTPMSYYQQPVTYSNERKSYGGRGGYREENYKRERKDFQTKPRERFSPSKRRSPYQRSHETHGSFRKDSKKSHGRYEVKAPRLTYDVKELSSSTLKFRYPKLYTPSDFFHTRLNVQEAFPLYRPMKLGNHCEFQVLNKEVEVEDAPTTILEPEDADYKYSAKVMLMTTPSLPELSKLTCHMPVEGGKYGLYKNIQFLVGSKGKNEPMAIGGPWSPSLDGPNPEEDTNVLVNTAIRTCKSLTGIDLSRCKKWYKFLDIHYYRPTSRKEDTEKKDESVTEVVEEPTMEFVTIFIPDVWSCVPSDAEWAELRAKYERKLQTLLNPPIIEEVKEVIVEKVAVEEVKEEEPKAEVIEEKMETDKVVEPTEEKVDEGAPAEVDLNQMKVTELRAELATRGLETKGLKLQLVQRLQEAIDNEKKQALIKPETVKAAEQIEKPVVETITVVDVKEAHVEPPKIDVSKLLPEKEQKRLERIYRLNEKPSILVHANKNAKGGRFECAEVTLESLLEYRSDDQKEHTFEVSLFAEQFSEMLQRDAAFVIYKSLLEMPEPPKENSGEPDAKKSRSSEITVANGARKSKMIADMDLLFAFCVFDSDNGGQLRDHDLEYILHCIGLNLSRSQVKRLLSKMPSKKGVVSYQDVVEREVIEGSPEDLASLRSGRTAIDRLIELAQGNKSFFEETDTDQLAKRSGPLLLLDRLNASEHRRIDHELQLALLKDELTRLTTVQAGAAEVESHLRENIKKIQDKLAVEKEAFTKLSEVSKTYSSLLRSSRDHMDISIKEINHQFDLEKQAAEAKAKEEADRIKAEADRAKEEADKIKAEAEEADRIKAEAEKAKEEVEEEAVAEVVQEDPVAMEEGIADTQ